MSDNRIHNKMVDELLEAMLTIENREEFYSFFEDLCTIQEIQTLAQRFAVAKLLDQGMKYDDIVEKTRASTATISRVKRFLDYGADGYKTILNRIKN